MGLPSRQMTLQSTTTCSPRPLRSWGKETWVSAGRGGRQVRTPQHKPHGAVSWGGTLPYPIPNAPALSPVPAWWEGDGCAVSLLVTLCPPAGLPDPGSLGYEELVRRNVVGASGKGMMWGQS